jgi:hypothetical protein
MTYDGEMNEMFEREIHVQIALFLFTRKFYLQGSWKTAASLVSSSFSDSAHGFKLIHPLLLLSS